MGGLIQPAPSTEQSESNWATHSLGVGLVVIVVGAIAFFLREAPKNEIHPIPYAANIKLSDLKMSGRENLWSQRYLSRWHTVNQLWAIRLLTHAH